MTVAELIALLQTFPQDIPVTGYNGQEATNLITTSGVRLREAKYHDWLCPEGTSEPYIGPYVDIMGY